MKPTGPIPEGFEAVDGELIVGGKTAQQLMEEAGGSPLFVYSRALMTRRIAELRAAMPEQLAIHYAVKANPYLPLLNFMRDQVDGFDIASAGELELAKVAGMDMSRVSFAGPGKRDAELALALENEVTLNCESEGEARRIFSLADKAGICPHIAIRVNPSFELRGSGMKMGGGAKQFGIDEERVPALVREVLSNGADWRGFHIFTGSQALDEDAIIETQANVLNLAARLADEAGAEPPHLNMGGGFGIPYFHKEEPLDIRAIGEALSERLATLPAILSDTKFAIELGRYLVGEAGVYLTRIIDRKESHGLTFLVTDGGLHHQLAASGNFGTVVRRNYPIAIANRFDSDALETVNVVGCLCTPLDRLADSALLPQAQPSDIVAVFCAGAYGATASPENFLGHGAARELLV